MAICTCCGRQVPQDGKSTSFPCPSCLDVVIWRCSKCRRLSNNYTCPNCGFTGP